MSGIFADNAFAGKSVFVSGGTSGIGLGIAEAFARHGARLAVMSRSRDKVDAAVETLAGLGAEAVGHAADVRDYPAVEAALEAAHGQIGDFDVLVSAAAGNFVAPALGMSANAFRTVVDIDLNGSFNVLRAAHRFLRKPGASVINISAPQATIPYPLQAHACAAKSGIDMLTRVLAGEWGVDGVRVNSISPGPIAGTEGMARLAPSQEAEDHLTASIPLGRYGEKREIGDAAMFLSSPQAAYITGVVLPVDGGASLGGVGAMGETMKAALAEQQPRT